MIKSPLALKALVSWDFRAESTFEIMSKHMPKAIRPTSYYISNVHGHLKSSMAKKKQLSSIYPLLPFTSAFSPYSPVLLGDILYPLASQVKNWAPSLAYPPIKWIDQSCRFYPLNIFFLMCALYSYGCSFNLGHFKPLLRLLQWFLNCL